MRSGAWVDATVRKRWGRKVSGSSQNCGCRCSRNGLIVTADSGRDGDLPHMVVGEGATAEEPRRWVQSQGFVEQGFGQLGCMVGSVSRMCCHSA